MASREGKVNIKTVRHRHAMDMAFRGIGGIPALTEWAKENPKEFYQLWMQTQKKEVTHKHSVQLLSPEEREQRLGEILATAKLSSPVEEHAEKYEEDNEYSERTWKALLASADD